MSRTAALFLHFQNDTLHPQGRVALGLAQFPDLRDRTIERATALLASCRRAAVDIIHMRISFAHDYSDVPLNIPLFAAVARAQAMQADTWGADFIEPMQPLAGEVVMVHNRVNAFQGTGLADLLWLRRVDQLVIAGVASNSTVEHSARHAADLGLDVIVAEDASATARADLHAGALENIRLIGRTMTVASLTEYLGAA